MLRKAFLASIILTSFICTSAQAENCNNPDALGVSRTLKVSVAQGAVGTLSYKKTLDLQDHEVVLTFDDGPIAKNTPRVLAALEKECVKATFFTVGTMTSAYPKLVQDEAQAGHTIGTHTWSHRYLTQKRNRYAAEFQIGGGLHAASIALGDEQQALSPFFRFPGLNHNKRLDSYVAKNGLMPMSVDIVADDWLLITPKEVLKRTLARLEERKRGIILLHDIHNRTATMLPELLRELKTRSYKVVHLVPEIAETQVALNNLAEPEGQSYQLAMNRTRTRMSKLGTPLEQSPIAQAPQMVEAVVATAPKPMVQSSIIRVGNLQKVGFAQGNRAPITASFVRLEMRGMQ